MMTQHSGRSSSLRGVVDRPVLALAALCSVLLVLPTLVAGQNPPPPAQAAAALQQAVSQNPGLANVIRQRIGQSGMTPDQIRARLPPGDVGRESRGQAPGKGFFLVRGGGQRSARTRPPARVRALLSPRLGRVYSGVRRNPTATTRFDISVANVRANQAYVVGEV